MKKDTINIIFGDSIAYGKGDYECFGWVNRIHKKLILDNNINHYFFNMSIPGQSSIEITPRLKNELVNRFNPYDDYNLIFAFGIKDALLLKKQDNHQECFKVNLTKAIKTAKKCAKKIYFLGLLDVDYQKRPEYQKDNIEIIEQIIQEICHQENVTYISMKNLVDISELPDGLHPNENGHAKIATYLYNQIYQSTNY